MKQSDPQKNDSLDDGFLEDISNEALELCLGSLWPGKTVNKGHYKIIKLIGKGGMGEVYLAEDTELNREVALKVLAEKFSQDKKQWEENFKKEAQAAAQLGHRNILTVYDFFVEEGTGFIVTEFVEGENLRKKLQSKSLDLSTALSITLEIASALEAAHERGIVHRDIKPENIMIKQTGDVKILDFGIAKLTEQELSATETNAPIPSLTETESGFGTLSYMSPEQLRRQNIDARSDIWSLGVCLYEMLTGRKPFPGKDTTDIWATILKLPPVKMGEHIPPQLNAIVNKALQREREDRYQTISEFRLDLDNLNQQLKKSSINSNGGVNTFDKWKNTSGKKIWNRLFYCIYFSLIFSLALITYHYLFNPNQTETEKYLATLEIKNKQDKEVSEDEIKKKVWETREIKTAQNVQAIASLFHLILIALAFHNFYKNPGLQDFRDIKNDIKNGRLKSNIRSSTGYKRIDDWITARKKAKAVLKDYREVFGGLLGAWFLLYLFLLLRLFIHTGEKTFGENLIISGLTMFNYWNTVFSLLCFRILNEDSGAIPRRYLGFLIIALGLAFILAAIEFSLASLSPEQADHIHQFSKLVSGALGGVAMALFVGRFQSKFLKSPDWLVAILFFYTVIQALFIFFGDKSIEAEIYAAVIIHIALFLKCLLILYMFWLFQSGRLIFYFVRLRRTVDQVDDQWRNFREVLQQES